jgi:uncharacterized protein (DUF2147 family)
VTAVKALAPAALIATLFAAGAAQAADPVMGDWMTSTGSGKVRIAPCGDKLCGTIVWLKKPLDAKGQPQKDEANPDPKLRDRPVVGLTLIKDFRKATQGKWVDGKIYDPQTGKTYASKLSPNPDGTLKVEGCISVICQAQTWKRAN